MPQTGLHSLAATVISEKIIPSQNRKPLAWGLLLGSILPDIDILPVVIAYLLTGNLSALYVFHRSITHSLTAVIVTLLLFLIISKVKKDKKYLLLGVGLSLGILLHILLDIFW